MLTEFLEEFCGEKKVEKIVEKANSYADRVP